LKNDDYEFNKSHCTISIFVIVYLYDTKLQVERRDSEMNATQTVNISVLEMQTVINASSMPSVPNVPNAGSQLSSILDAVTSNPLITFAVAVTVILLILALIFMFKRRGNIAKVLLSLMILPALTLLVGLTHSASATSSLALTRETLDVTFFKNSANSDDIMQTVTSATTVTTDNATGYTMSVRLGNALDNNITVVLDDEILTVEPTNVYADDTGASPSSYDHTLEITLPADVAEGNYTLDIIYDITENLPNAPQTMQAMSKGYCDNSMALNETLTLTDTRNGQNYQVRKLADGNCWMVNNLKLGKVTETMTLTDVDTDLNNKASFTLPALVTGGTSNLDDPRAYGPVDGDNSGEAGSASSNSAVTGSAFYGYLYNWSAVTAGESRTSKPADSGDALNSICPKGWHLPTGGPTGEFAYLNGMMAGDGAYSTLTNTAHSAQWQFGNLFNGVLAGLWLGGFGDQGSGANYWTSTLVPSSSSGIYYLSFNNMGVGVDGGYNRNAGFAARCLLR
jgi:uncharacterized protein (TIGR02145 family)